MFREAGDKQFYPLPVLRPRLRIQVMQSAGFGSSFTFSAYSQAITSTPEGETLHVFELPEGYVLNVPVSTLAVTIPRKDLKNSTGKGSKLNPRYFLFQNERRPDSRSAAGSSPRRTSPRRRRSWRETRSSGR